MDNQEKKRGKLFVVSTPIGNKDDISIRAMSVLKICDFVLCEELREGAKFLKSINLQKEIESLNEQNEVEQSLLMLEKLESGSKIALISDCGTPVFADPGQHLVRAAIKAKIEIEVIPGASSIMTALVRSGLDISSFVYAGFVSRKSDERLFELKELSKETRTVVLLETPYRFSAFLENAAKVMPDRNAYIGMNLTMPYETHHYGTFAQLQKKFEGENVKAEFVVCFEGVIADNTFAKAADRLRSEDSDEMSYRKPRFDSDRRPSGNRAGGNFAPKPFKSRDDKPSFRPRPGGSSRDRDYKPRFDRDNDSGFKPRFDRDNDSGFKPRFDRDNDSGFKPRFDRDSEGGERPFKPRFDRDNDSGFKPRFDRDNDSGFKPRFDRDSEGGERPFKPRFDSDSEGGERPFKPRFERNNDRTNFKPRSGGGDRGFKPRSGGDRDGGFKPRFDRDSNDRSSGFKPRSSGDRDGGFKPRSDRDGGFKPRFDRDSNDRGSGFKPRSSGGDRDGGFKPRSSGGDRDGGFKPRFDRDSSSDRPFKPRTDRDGGFKPSSDRPFKKRDSAGGKSKGFGGKSSGFKSKKRF